MASQRRDIDCEEGRGLIENQFDPPPSYDEQPQQSLREAGRASDPPNYQVAAKLPTYEESERTKGEITRPKSRRATGFPIYVEQSQISHQ